MNIPVPALAEHNELKAGLQTPAFLLADKNLRTIPRRVPFGSDTNSIVLHDGRVLAYSFFGKDDGFPIFYFHSIGSSRLECALFDGSANRLGFRLIAFDRPGTGQSEFRPGRRFEDIAADVVELADNLGLQRFGLMSFSTGGMFALTTAYSFPSRVKFQLSLGGVPGVFLLNQRKTKSCTARVLNTVVPFSMRILTRIKHELSSHTPADKIEQLREMLNYTDRKLLSNPAFSSIIEVAMKESIRQGNQGIAYDTGLSFKHPGFHPTQIEVPVSIWQGDADNLNSRFANEFLAARIPLASCHSVANRGHFFFVHCMDEIFGRTKHYVYSSRYAV